MRNILTKNAPASGDLVQDYIDTAYDNVKLVADNIPLILELVELLGGGDPADVLYSTDIDTLAELNAIITDAVLLDEANVLSPSEIDSLSKLSAYILDATLASTAYVDGLIASTVAYVDSAVVGLYEHKGGWNAVTALPDLTTMPNGVLVGDAYVVTAAGTFYGEAVEIGDVMIATVNEPGALASWTILQTNVDHSLFMLQGDNISLLTNDSGFTDDQTGAEIKTAYELEADTNAFTDAEKTSLGTMEDNSKDDQTSVEIKAGFDAEVAVVSQGDAEAGTSTDTKQWTPERVKQAIVALAAGGTGVGDLKADGSVPLSSNWSIGGFNITNMGLLVLGNATSVGARLGQTLEGSTVSNYGGLTFNTWSGSNQHAPLFDFNRSASAVIGTQTIVADGMAVGYFNFRASDGVAFQDAASIHCYVDGTPAAGDMPGRLAFYTTPSGSASSVVRQVIAPNGYIGLGGIETPIWPLDMVGNIRGTNTISDTTTKSWGLRVRNYNNALADFGFFLASSWSSRNQVDFGGGGGGLSATRIDFFTHPTPTTSDTANNTRRMRLSTDGLKIDPGGMTAATYAAYAVDAVGDINTTGTFRIGGRDVISRYLGQNLQTGTSYELVLGDAGKIIEMNNAGANTLTIPANAAVAFPVDTRIDILQYGAGLTSVVITTDTLRGDAVSLGQYKGLSLWKRAATEWVIFGGTT